MISGAKSAADFYCTVPRKALLTFLNYSVKSHFQHCQAIFFTSLNSLSQLPAHMLTLGKLALLLEFGWDAARFANGGSAAEKAPLAAIDWRKVASLLQDLMLPTKKLVAPDYARLVHRQLVAASTDKATAPTFIGYASTL